MGKKGPTYRHRTSRLTAVQAIAGPAHDAAAPTARESVAARRPRIHPILPTVSVSARPPPPREDARRRHLLSVRAPATEATRDQNGSAASLRASASFLAFSSGACLPIALLPARSSASADARIAPPASSEAAAPPSSE